jgi:hypothetical protein
MPAASPVVPITATLTAPPTPPPQRTDPANFRARADATVAWWPTQTAEMTTMAAQVGATAARINLNANEAYTNATEAATSATTASAQAAAAANSASTALNAASTSGTSTTAATLAVGSISLTTQTGKAWVVGQSVELAATAAIGNGGLGQVSAYNSGTGAITIAVQSIYGTSASYSAWAIAPSARSPIAGQLAQLPALEPSFAINFTALRGVPSSIVATGGACRVIGRNQQYQDSPANTAALDWDIATARPRGLIVEGARSFTALWSSDLTNAAWARTNVAAPTLATLTFRGEPLYTVAKSNTTTGANLAQALTATANPISHVLSVALAAGTAAQCDLQLLGANAPTVGVDADSTALIVTGPGTLARVAGAHWRITGLSATVPTLIEVRRSFVSVAEATSIAVLPDTTASTTSGASVLVGRLAVERGAGILRASSYTRTTTATVTRTVDLYTIGGSDFADFWSQEQGTFVIAATVVHSTGGRVFFRFDDGNFSERFYGYVLDDGRAFIQNFVANVQVASAQVASGLTSGTRVCLGVSYIGGTWWGSCNGAAAVSLGTGAIGTKNRLHLGSNAGSDAVDGPVHALAYYPKAVTASELAALTSYWRGT